MTVRSTRTTVWKKASASIDDATADDMAVIDALPKDAADGEEAPNDGSEY